jgi:hypothetical protein
MKKKMLIAAISIAAAALSATTPAAAQNARSFVSGHGNDTNSCLYAAPCRTFAAAYNRTNPGGEISVLDPAGFGPLTITRALSIVNDGVGEASIVLVGPGNAITVNAGAGDAISLRGLTLDGSGTTGTTGIKFNSGAALTIQNCVIRHFGIQGLYFQPGATSNLAVSNTFIADNAGSGVVIESFVAGTVTAVFNRVEINNNASAGLFVDSRFATGGSVDVTVSESVAAKNGTYGFAAATQLPAVPTTLTLVRSVAANNATGIYALAATSGATLRIADSAVIANTTHGWWVDTGGVIASYGDNSISGNGANIGSLTPLSTQ